MAEADVRLKSHQVTIEAWDLELKAADRQDPYPGEYRRALVHDRGDRLTMNWGHDYQGGINLIGVKTISAYDPPGDFIVADDSRNRLAIEGNVDIRGSLKAKIVINWTRKDLTAGWLEPNSVFLPAPDADAEVVLEGLLFEFAGTIVALMTEVLSMKESLSEVETRLTAVEQATA